MFVIQYYVHLTFILVSNVFTIHFLNLKFSLLNLNLFTILHQISIVYSTEGLSFEWDCVNCFITALD